MTESELLQTQLKDLPLFQVNERLHSYREVLSKELRQKGVKFDFHLWVSDEWFCPDGVPGFAVPFYIFNPRLYRLHKQQVGFAEGRTDRQILKLMRHELGHAIDNAFYLRDNPQRQAQFGDSQQAYPVSYQPKSHCSSFVRYLGDGYAQSHPDEDFAETFAYWLDPQTKWQGRNLHPKVRQKLELIDQMMGSLPKPRLKNRYKIDPIEKNHKTLQQHFAELRAARGHRHWRRIDHSLQRAFAKPNQQDIKLSRFLRQSRRELSQQVAENTGAYRYQVDLVLSRLIDRAEGLGISGNLREFKRKAPSLLEENFRYLRQRDELKHYL